MIGYLTTMTRERREKIKIKIILEIDLMNNEISQLEEKTKPIAPDCSLGRLTREEMMIEQQIYQHSLHEAQIRLSKLKYALNKVDKEDYGICVECEEEIVFERLMLLPESSHCVACKSELGL